MTDPQQPPPSPSWPPRDAEHLLLSGPQMAAVEQRLFTSGLPVEALMEKAALAVTAALVRDHGALLQRHGALVLVGPGHNGGDGLVIARELHLAGIETTIWSPFERHKPLTASHLRHARWLGIRELTAEPDPASPTLWIDALFGIGQNRPLGPALETLLSRRQRSRAGALVAIDVPSGIDDSSGEPLGQGCAVAAATYTIGLIKRGLVQDPALAVVGELQRIDLGLPAQVLQELDLATPLGLGEQDADAQTLPWPALNPAASKYQRGRLLAIAGSEAYRGAAQLALLGAGASGLGSLRVATAAPLAEQLWAPLPHVVVQRRLACSPEGSLLLGALADTDLQRLDAVLIGPGIGAEDADAPAGQAAESAAWERLQAFAGLLVIDADGLNRVTTAWLQQRRGPTWITPHPGEFARLWPRLAGIPPLEAAMRAAEDCGAAVLLKGARSVIASPEGQRWQLLQASPAAARAGLGDVLAGYASGRGAMAMASGQPCSATWLAAAALEHAIAGVQRERDGGAGSVDPAAVAKRLGQHSLTTTGHR